MKSVSTSAATQGISPSYLNWAQTRHRSDETEHFIDPVSQERQGELTDSFAVIIQRRTEGAEMRDLNQQLDSFIIAIIASLVTQKL